MVQAKKSQPDILKDRSQNTAELGVLAHQTKRKAGPQNASWPSMHGGPYSKEVAPSLSSQLSLRPSGAIKLPAITHKELPHARQPHLLVLWLGI